MIQDVPVKILLLLDFYVSFNALFLTLGGTITHLFYQGKSNSAIKKLRKQYTFLEWIRLCHVKNGCLDRIRHKKALLVFLRLRDIYLGILLLTALLHLLALVHILPIEIWKQYLMIKWCSVDVSLAAYFFIMTKHDKKHGGCTWRWE